MNIPERRIRIVVSDVVTDFRRDFFNSTNCPDIDKSYHDAISKLDGILLLFSAGKISRFIKAYQDEVLQLGQILGLTPSKTHQGEITDNESKAPDCDAQITDAKPIAMAVQS